MKNELVDLSKKFAVNVVNLCSALEREKKANVLINQLLKSGTSIGANIREGNYAASLPDFINKFQIALKECYETEYWLEIFTETKIISNEQYSEIISDCNKLRKLLTSSIRTAKNNLPQ